MPHHAQILYCRFANAVQLRDEAAGEVVKAVEAYSSNTPWNESGVYGEIVPRLGDDVGTFIAKKVGEGNGFGLSVEWDNLFRKKQPWHAPDVVDGSCGWPYMCRTSGQ